MLFLPKWSPEVKRWSPTAPSFPSWSPGYLHFLGRSPGALNPFGALDVESLFIAGLHCKILKSKLARPAKFLSSPGVGTPKYISFHKFLARYHHL